MGEEMLWENNVFEAHATSIKSLPVDIESLDLAPFTYVNKWQQKFDRIMHPKRNRKHS